MQFCTNWFENIVVRKCGVLNQGRICLTKNSVLTDYLKVGLCVNSNGPQWSRSWNFLNKLNREFFLSIFRSEALFGHPVIYDFYGGLLHRRLLPRLVRVHYLNEMWITKVLKNCAFFLTIFNKLFWFSHAQIMLKILTYLPSRERKEGAGTGWKKTWSFRVLCFYEKYKTVLRIFKLEVRIRFL